MGKKETRAEYKSAEESVGGQTPICPEPAKRFDCRSCHRLLCAEIFMGVVLQRKCGWVSLLRRSQTYGTRTGGVNRRKKDGRCGGSRRADGMAPKGGGLTGL